MTAINLLAKAIGTSESNVRDFMGVYDFTVDDIKDDIDNLVIQYLIEEEGLDDDPTQAECILALMADGYATDAIDAMQMVSNEFVGKFDSERDFAQYYLDELCDWAGVADVIKENINLDGVWDDIRSYYNYVTVRGELYIYNA